MAGPEDRGLGAGFVATAADMLRPGGVLRMVANVALPYEEPSWPDASPEVTSDRPRGRLQSAGGGGVSVRLDRLLANLGYGSRREVQALIARGRGDAGRRRR